MTHKQDLVELKYFSEISRGINLSNLSEITSEAVISNKSNGITGILFFDYGYFGQILEGERDNVEDTWGKIQKDKRHQNVKLLSLSVIKERRFPDWAMKLFDATDFSRQFPQFSEIVESLNDVDLETYQAIKNLWSKV